MNDEPINEDNDYVDPIDEAEIEAEELWEQEKWANYSRLG